MKPLARERGQSLVEITLLLPILIILFLGIAEVGFFLYSQVQVANATREGARYGSLCRLNQTCSSLTNAVQSAVFAEARGLGMTTANTSVVVQPASLSLPPAVGAPITVTVTYTHTPPFISNFVPMFPSQIPVQHTVVMNFDK